MADIPSGSIVIAPDGTPGSVPPEKLSQALAQGYKRAMIMTSPDGQLGAVPIENAIKALSQGYKPGQDTPQYQPPAALDFLQRFVQGGGVPTNSDQLKAILTNPADTRGPQHVDPINLLRNIGQGIADRVHQGAQQGGVSGTIQALYAGTPLAGLGENVSKGNYAGALGQIFSAALAGAAPAAGMEKPAIAVPVDDPAALAEKITNRVNPPAKQMSAFQANLQKQLPNVPEAADVANNPPKLAQVLKSASDAKRSLYYDQMLGPVKSNAVPVPDTYQGQTVQPGWAQLGQLDKRLSQINATLSPKYAKGGMAAQAAVTAEQSAALNAEAAQIRSTLYQEIGRAQGIDPAVVADTRGSFGALSDLAEKVQTAANKERIAKNIARRQLPRELAVNAAKSLPYAGAAAYGINKLLQ